MSRAPQEVVLVHIELDGETRWAGTAYVSERRGVVSTVFDYATSYLADPAARAVSPDLPLTGRKHRVEGLPGAFADSAPDRWGRNLIQKRFTAQARTTGGQRRSLREVDYLLGVGDSTRQGALRFARADGPFLAADGDGVPTVLELPQLLHAADTVARASDDDWQAVKALLVAGTGTLGGARPKATVRSEQRLMIAKFPHHGDQWDVMAWEKTALDLAESCGIRTPSRELIEVDGRHVLLLDRFDRRASATGQIRVPYTSGMSLIGGRDGGLHDYVDLAEALSSTGSSVGLDLRELWCRIAFSVVINNVDDHMRNHGFLNEAGGWRLSPVFDVNPDPDPDHTRVSSIGGAVDAHGCREALLDLAEDFNLSDDEAQTEFASIVAATDNWRDVATRNGCPSAEIATFADALDRFR